MNTGHGRRSGALIIAHERERHELEGWTPEHDDEHSRGEMAKAAAAYAMASYGSAHAYEFWPWRAGEWKPTSRIACLIKAGALIAAEIDRLRREEERELERKLGG